MGYHQRKGDVYKRQRFQHGYSGTLLCDGGGLYGLFTTEKPHESGHHGPDEEMWIRDSPDGAFCAAGAVCPTGLPQNCGQTD